MDIKRLKGACNAISEIIGKNYGVYYSIVPIEKENVIRFDLPRGYHLEGTHSPAAAYNKKVKGARAEAIRELLDKIERAPVRVCEKDCSCRGGV